MRVVSGSPLVYVLNSEKGKQPKGSCECNHIYSPHSSGVTGASVRPYMCNCIVLCTTSTVQNVSRDHSCSKEKWLYFICFLRSVKPWITWETDISLGSNSWLPHLPVVTRMNSLKLFCYRGIYMFSCRFNVALLPWHKAQDSLDLRKVMGIIFNASGCQQTAVNISALL